ncbi:MAG: hypothetical protein HYX68_28620 [Planctomycetes bacterium]|jgi:hypothetical protein|nr:hypothetical protein [Planctomycetota bacterium]
MNAILSLNLIHFLDFYFALMFFAGLVRRLRQYQSVGQLVVAGPKRWPHLLKLVSEYRTIFWNLSMFLPLVIALTLLIVQVLASRFLFPEAGVEGNALTVDRLLEYWPALFIVAPLGAAMIGFDCYTLYLVGQIDNAMLEKYFDQAEFWLRSRTAHVVRVVTFGWIHPRRMVAEEVEKALLEVGDLLNLTLWWVIVQMGLRFGFGLSLWITWAVAQAG